MQHLRWAAFALQLLALAGCQRVPTTSPPAGPAAGVYEVLLKDALTGEPIAQAAIVGYDCDQLLAEVTPSGPEVSPDGVYGLSVDPTTGSARFAADGYSETWTPRFRRSQGIPRRIEVAMMPLSRIVVTVLEPDGTPVVEGALLLVGPGRTEALVVRDGVADKPVDAGRVQLRLDPRLMEGYRAQSRTVTLRPGETTELTLRVERE